MSSKRFLIYVFGIIFIALMLAGTLQVIAEVEVVNPANQHCYDLNAQGLKIGCPKKQYTTAFSHSSPPDFSAKYLGLNFGFYALIGGLLLAAHKRLWDNRHKHEKRVGK